VLVGVFKGRTIGQNIPSIGGRNLSGVFFVGIIPSVALTPFFAFGEIGRVIDERELDSLIFTDGAKLLHFSLEFAARAANAAPLEGRA
jgi:hypothetical protein